jgi:CelD/BcsL family acetyltransferase involved in cellulose biosynthesis
MIAVDIMPGFGALPSLRRSWEDVFQARPHEPSTSYEWTCALVRHHVDEGDQCFLMRLRRAGVVVGLVPLIARRAPLRMGLRMTVLTPLSETYNTHSDLLLTDTNADTVSAFVRGLLAIGARWDSFSMGRLMEHSPLTTTLRETLNAQRSHYLFRDGLPSYFLPLPASYVEYLACRSGKFRNHLRRVEKKLQSAGTAAVRQVESPSGLEAALAALLEVERASWKHEHGSSIAAVERQAGFYADFARGAQDAGRLHLQSLHLDGRPAAYNLGYVEGGRYHYLKTSYDAALRPLGPATFLRARLIESLIAEGVTEIDFPGEPYEWEAQWTNVVRWHTTLALRGPTAIGRLLAVVSRLRHRPRERRVEHVDPRAAGLVDVERA